MTNREKLMEELGALSNEALYAAIGFNRLNVALDSAKCADCKAGHGGQCVAPDDDPCPVTFEDWMEAEAREAAILPGV